MNVLLVNASPHEKGCTYTALSVISETLNSEGIDTKIVNIGKTVKHPCIACMACTKLHKCVFDDDVVNECAQLLQEADGFIIGEPVYYGAPASQAQMFMDRMFYSNNVNYKFKPAAAIASCRRGGLTAAMDRMNKYFTISQMPIVSSNYWNGVHGNVPEEVLQDAEGLQTMRILARNMAWMIKCIDAGKKAGIEMPVQEEKIRTNFIR
ncbi:MAG: flavodoxin family protein [Candidatus Metalachnospira sp.]|nr:flavodoxin family protein [Candidatus Metalachnospira sp.]